MTALRFKAFTALGALVGVMLMAVPASATTKQVTMLPPQDGSVSSSPDEPAPDGPHHTVYGGNYSFDVANRAGGPVYARFRNANGALALKVAVGGIGRACGSGSFADGGDRIALDVFVDGTHIGKVVYAHLTRFAYGVGQSVPVGARIGDAVTANDGVVAREGNGCWTGPHVHVEPRNVTSVACYFRGLFRTSVTGSTAMGIVGGERAGGSNTPCPADAESGGGGGGGGGGAATAATGGDGANVRADATTSSAVLTTIPGRTTITLECWRRGQGVQAATGTYSLWHRTTYTGQQGFVSDSTLNTPAFPNAGADQPAAGEPECPAAGPPPDPTVSTGGDGANVRADATTSSAVLTAIPGRTAITLECWRRGQAVQAATGTYSLWHRTTYNSVQGFVSDSTLNTPAFPDPAADQPAAGEPECPAPAPEVPVVTPSVGVAPTSGDHTVQFRGTGNGFTPSSTARLTAYAPGGSEYPAAYTRERAVDANGAFSWTWQWDPGDADGTYRFVFTDSTGPTAETTLTIAPDAPQDVPQDGLVLGFDTYRAPTLDQMRAWTASPYRAIGVYIPVRAAESDNRFDKQQTNLTASWVAEVDRLGYDVLPVYFGKQAPQACFPADYWRMSADPAISRQQGLTAAADADASADGLGIPNSTPVVHDTEAFGNGCDAAVSAYLGGWTEGLHAAGRRSAVYGSTASTTRLLRDTATRPSPAPDALWAATDNGQPNTSSLGASYAPWAGKLGNQYALDVSETHGGVTLSIDRNAFEAGMLTQTPSEPDPAPTDPPVEPSPSADLLRLAGADRYSTAVAISRDAWPAGQAEAVVLARGDAFPDALAGTPLAVVKRAPLLLTPSASLGSAAADELKRVLPTGRAVYLLGGPVAISDAVARSITNLGYRPVRLAGPDRYATATVISRQIGNPTTIFEATGLSFPSALVAGVAAAKVGGVVVLTADGQMPASTKTYLAERPGVSRVAVGREATAADPSARSIAGADKYQTARLLAEAFFDQPAVAAVASGTVFADALAGGAHVGKAGGPLLLSEPTTVPTPIRSYLSTNASTIGRGYLYGGPAALSTTVQDTVHAALNGG